MIYAAISGCGRRERNEDYVFIPLHKEISLAVVTDAAWVGTAAETWPAGWRRIPWCGS